MFFITPSCCSFKRLYITFNNITIKKTLCGFVQRTERLFLQLQIDDARYVKAKLTKHMESQLDTLNDMIYDDDYNIFDFYNERTPSVEYSTPIHHPHIQVQQVTV